LSSSQSSCRLIGIVLNSRYAILAANDILQQ
jgi:hypothetical protein